MKRRTFVLGTGSVAIGGSALLGSGAFSRVESQRAVTIEVAEDPSAYLGLDGCPDSANSSYTDLDEKGHLEVDMTPENPTDVGGEGVNSDSLTWFDDVFQICNQGKQAVCVWIHDDEDWPRVDEEEFPDEDLSAYDGDRRVNFYLGSDRERSLLGEENGVVLGVGACICVGVHTLTKGLSAGDELLEDLEDTIKIIADEAGECPNDIPPEEGPPEENGIEELSGTGISFVAFCNDGPVGIDDITITHTDDGTVDGEPTGISWSSTDPVTEVILKGGQEWYLYTYDDATSGEEVLMSSNDADDWKSFGPQGAHSDESPPFRFDSDGEGDAQRCESSPCLDRKGTKIDYNGEFDTGTPDHTKEDCPPRN